MEFWTISNKLILLIYVVATTFISDIILSPWYTLSFLIYLCVNISIYIVKKNVLKQLFIVLSIVQIIVSAYFIHPLFILLMPINLFEAVSLYKAKYWVALVTMFIPIAFLQHDLITLYAFIAVVTFMTLTMLRFYTSRIETYNNSMEKMRDDIEKLTKNLNENNEYIKQSEYTFKLEERNRLSQEIHDKIGHSMTGALIQMEASKRLIDTDKEKATELLQNAILISKEGIESIRLVLKNIKPSTELLGINRIRLFIDEFSAKHSLKAILTHSGNTDIISPIQWKIIYENTKEALTNTMKYSGATSVYVDIRVLHSFIKLQISDNGKGAEKVVKGLGILGMEERTAAVNGTIIVDGTRGFSVTALIPYKSIQMQKSTI